MSAENDTRMRYLELAVDARRAIDALVHFVERGQRQPDFDNALQAVVNALGADRDTATLVANLQASMSLRGYEEQVTLKQVASREDRQALQDNIRQLLLANATVETAKDAVRLFSKLETRALHYFNAPRSSSIDARPA